MAAGAALIAVDTNLLIYAHRRSQPEHLAAKRAIQKACDDIRGWGIALPCIAEFWSVVTHPASFGGPSTPQQAQDFLIALIQDAEASLWLPREGFGGRLTRLAADLAVQGPRIFDLQIGLIGFENGASEIWTHDRGFTALPGMSVYDPLSDG